MNNRGQIVVEYILLLVIAVGLAALLTKQLVSRNTDDPGIITSKWFQILKDIGKDLPDKHK
jgi:uncharacterized protein (UPF0333 family)